eukprot:TRINITY_DN2583_c0_g1_i4.p1 TRINITY_DN2583_c0_g1~~TRINITY_DN2583_c0_g1_i4.p1  ORF type:complete len:248 (-),score=65.96 TRINITY_DN2583_c0_g1_i4:72-815(-)
MSFFGCCCVVRFVSCMFFFFFFFKQKTAYEIMPSLVGSEMCIRDRNQTERVSKIFDRINSIQSNIENEKSSRFKQVFLLIKEFEKNLDDINQRKEEKFQQQMEKLVQVQELLETEKERIDLATQDLQKDLINIEKSIKKLQENNNKEKTEKEKVLLQAIGQKIDNLQQEIAKEAQAQGQSHQYLNQYSQEDLPRLKDELQYEIAQRKEVEEKIYNQFIEQVNELKETFEKEKKERETKEQELSLIHI